jgi:hypothetical protein
MVGVPGPVQFWAALGSVSVTRLSLNSAAGTYDVILKTEDPTYNTAPEIRGTFAVTGCGSLSNVSDFAQLCSQELASDGGLVDTCNCQGKTSSGTCAISYPSRFPVVDCTCAAVSGAMSTCCVSENSSATCSPFILDGNGPFTGCCPMALLPDGG